MPETIDITPTWGEWGSVYIRLAESGEVDVIRHLRPDLARALAAAEALKELMPTLTEEQSVKVSEVLTRELQKQGY